MRRGGRAILIVAAAVAVMGLAALTGVGAARSTSPKHVEVCDNYYAPKTCDGREVGKVRIRKGARVKWVWSAANFNVHNVTLTRAPKGVRKSRFRSQTASAPFHFTKRFRKPGKYHFICTIHPGAMQMNVIVRRPG